MNKKLSYNNRLQEAKSLHTRELYQEALEIFESLRKEYPEKSKPISGAGACLFAMGERTQALGCFIQASKIDPNDVEIFLNMGHCLRSLGQDRIAMSQYKKVLSIDPNNVQALSELGLMYFNRHRHFEAADVLKKAVAIKASNSDNQAHLALTLATIGNYEEALKHANKSIRLDQKTAYGHFVMGAIHLLHGNQNEADKFLNKAIEINPHYGAAYHAISAKKMTQKNQSLIKKMENTLNQGMPTKDRELLLYALSKFYNDLKETEIAFEYARKANELSNPEFNLKELTQEACTLKKFFNKEFFSRKQFHSTATLTPIFIVGMPRSGSTLLDQILSAHSSVFSGGESIALYDTACEITDNIDNGIEYPAYIDTLEQTDIEKYSKAYFQKIIPKAGNVTHIIDKNLFNYKFLGLISILLPNAKIIHARRHPLDTALSCYMTGFASGLSWTNDLTWIGNYYRSYAELMDYWYKTLPNPILDVQYENVVENPEINVRRILEFCGLNWEDQCLNFYKSKRSVNTASIWQVRQPVYKSSIERWVPYAKHLQPLILALGDILEADYDKIESLGLKHGPRHNNLVNKISKFFK